MDQSITAATTASPHRLFQVVSDLTTYPAWLDLVKSVTPEGPAANPTNAVPGYQVTLRAKVGPFARSKRLRMVCTETDQPHSVSFERQEIDGREHATWLMSAIVVPRTDGSEVTFRLRYDGQMWSSMLDGVLAKMVESAVAKLQAYAGQAPS